MWRAQGIVRPRGIGMLVTALCFVCATARADPTGNVTNGKELYQERCVLCHGSAGQGWDWS